MTAAIVLALISSLFLQESSREERRREREEIQREAEARETKRLIDETILQIEEATANIVLLRAREKAVGARFSGLLESDEGRGIVADLAFIREFDRAYGSTTQSSEAELSLFEKNLKTVKGAFERDGAAPRGFTLESSDRKTVESIRVKVEERLERLAAAEKALELLVAAASRRAPSGDSVGPTLREQMEVIRTEEEKERLQAISEGEARGREEGRAQAQESARLTALEREKAKAEKDLLEAKLQIERLQNDLKILRAVKEKNAAAAEIEANRIRNEKAKAELLAECDRADVRALLAPFITPGYWQPKSGTTGELKPMSLAELTRAGALESTKNGLSALSHIGSESDDTRRPRWPYARGSGSRRFDKTDEGIQKVSKAQELLRRLGASLVEKGLLSP